MKPAESPQSSFLATLHSRFCSLLSKCVEPFITSIFFEEAHTCTISELLREKNNKMISDTGGIKFFSSGEKGKV